ncbi:hypothetical protein [Ochrobactrum sp. EDr1-4]|uniref:hypothetical protein n=1 Tax=Ochrobactrum sp. EDr1-4 TaxID=3368622 RepID=UPI003B9DCE28
MIYWLKVFFSQPDKHKKAFTEVLITTLFSIMPFIFLYLSNAVERQEFFSPVFYDLFGRGQLFLLAYSLFGTVFWLTIVQWDNKRHGPRITIGVIMVIIVWPLVGYMGFDPAFNNLLNPNFITLSYVYYSFVIFIYYLSLFFSKIDAPEPGSSIKRDKNTMRSNYEELKNGQ